MKYNHDFYCEKFNHWPNFNWFSHILMVLKAKIQLQLFYKMEPGLISVFSFSMFWILGFLTDGLDNMDQ